MSSTAQSKRNYNTIRQHQPLYAPEGWNEDERRFVHALSGIFDDIYMRYGRLTTKDLGKVLNETLINLDTGLSSVEGQADKLGGDLITVGQAITTLNEQKLAKTELLDAVYPVGSLYLSVLQQNPASLFGGTWERIERRFLLAAGDGYPLGSEGGEETHTLTVQEIPPHTHGTGVSQTETVAGTAGTGCAKVRAGNADEFSSGSTGEGQSHNNMPPYLAVCIWKRIA